MRGMASTVRDLALRLVVLLAACSDEVGGSGDASADGSSNDDASTSATNGATASASGADTSGASSSPSDTSVSDPTTGAASESTGVDTSSERGDDSSTGELVEPAIHVRAVDGLDSNPGTPEAPVRTIQHALELAVMQTIPNVYVAAGEYTASIPDEQALDVVGGISLLGGFAVDDWSSNDPLTHVTHITSMGGYTVRVVGGERDDTAVDGFALTGSGADPVLVIDGSPTIRRNVIEERQSITGGGIGIEVEGGAPRISRNRILVLEGNDIVAAGATGIRLLGGGALIDANMIYAQGEGLFDETHGTAIVVSTEAEVQILGNSLRGAGSPGRAISGWLTNTEIVGNNLIVPSTWNFFGCLDAYPAPPAVLTHNNFDCAAFYTVPGFQPISTIAELHAEVAGASDNVAVPLTYVDPLEADLHLVDVDALLCAFAIGGNDLGTAIDRDFDDVARTRPWTIGAEEIDTPCT